MTPANAIIVGAKTNANGRAVAMAVGLALFALVTPGNQADCASRPMRDANIISLAPMLPVHVWSNHRHGTGLVSISRAGELAYSELIQKPLLEPNQPGYWIEGCKIVEARRLFPYAITQFDFCDPVVVAGITYYRVQPAARRS